MPDITAEPNDFSPTPEDGSRGVWHDFQMASGVIHNDGLLAMPVSGPAGTPCLIVRTHAPMMRRQVQWRASKTGALPDIPKPMSLGNNDVMMGYQLAPAVPVLTGNGLARFYSTSGVYSYQLRVPINPVIGTPTGASPVDSETSAETVWPGSVLRTDLILGSDGFTG